MTPRDLDPKVAAFLKRVFSRELEGVLWRGKPSAAFLEALSLGYVARQEHGGVFRGVLSGYALTEAGYQAMNLTRKEQAHGR